MNFYTKNSCRAFLLSSEISPNRIRAFFPSIFSTHEARVENPLREISVFQAFEILFPYKPFFFKSSGLSRSHACLLQLNMNMTDNKSFDWEMSYYLTWSNVSRVSNSDSSFDRMELSSCIEHCLITDGHNPRANRVASRFFPFVETPTKQHRQAVVSENTQHFFVNF